METKNVKYIHYIICAAFCLLFRFVPSFAGITPMGMGILGSFIGAIYGWILIDMLWPSLLALLGAGLSIGMPQMLAASFGSETVVAMILCMMAVGLAMENGAFSWLAVKLLSLKFLEGKGYLTIFLIFVFAWLTGSFNPIIMCMIFCGFLTSMFKQIGVQKNDRLVVFVFLGVAYQLMRGQILFPFIGTGLVYLNAYRSMFPALPMPVTAYLSMMVIMGITMAVVFVALMKFVFRVDASAIANFKQEGGVQPATREQKIALWFFVAFIVVNIIANLNLGSITVFLQKFGIVGIAIVIGCLMPLFKDSEGKPVANLEKLLHLANWGQLAMVSYIMVLSRFLNTPETGVSTAMGYLFQPFLKLNPMIFIIVVMILATILTNIANNMLVTILCMPFLVNFAGVVGMDPVGMVALLFIISEFALCTPAASPVTAVAMSQEMVTPGAMMKESVKIVPLLFVVFMIIGWPLASFIF